MINFHIRYSNEADKIINHILESYFTRKNIKPNEYLIKEEVTPLKIIWEKFHYKIGKQPKTSLIDSNNKMKSLDLIYAKRNSNQIELKGKEYNTNEK